MNQLEISWNDNTPTDGKPLFEFRMELEIGLTLWQVPGGYCSIHRNSKDGYFYSSYQDEFLGYTWHEVLVSMGKAADELWSTFDQYEGHPPIEDVQRVLDYCYEVGERWQG